MLRQGGLTDIRGYWEILPLDLFIDIPIVPKRYLVLQPELFNRFIEAEIVRSLEKDLRSY